MLVPNTTPIWSSTGDGHQHYTVQEQHWRWSPLLHCTGAALTLVTITTLYKSRTGGRWVFAYRYRFTFALIAVDNSAQRDASRRIRLTTNEQIQTLSTTDKHCNNHSFYSSINQCLNKCNNFLNNNFHRNTSQMKTASFGCWLQKAHRLDCIFHMYR